MFVVCGFSVSKVPCLQFFFCFVLEFVTVVVFVCPTEQEIAFFLLFYFNIFLEYNLKEKNCNKLVLLDLKH